jgi:hypothetical protein
MVQQRGTYIKRQAHGKMVKISSSGIQVGNPLRIHDWTWWGI